MTYSSTLALIDQQRTTLDGASLWLETKRPDINLAVASCDWSEFVRLIWRRSDINTVVIAVDLEDVTTLAQKMKTLLLLDVRVIATGTSVDGVQVQAALAAGASGFICRNDGMPVFAEAVDVVSAGGTYVSERMADKLAACPDTRLHHAKRQVEALSVYASGNTMQQTAVALGLSEETVKGYLKKMRAACLAAGINIGTRATARQYALDRGYILAA